MNEQTIAASRLREDPRLRFSGTRHFFDLIDLNAQMLDEERFGEHGHRQMTIFHEGATSIVLFAFDEGGTMENHSVNGLVTIHVLDGALTVQFPDKGREADWKANDLRQGHVLILDVSVMHKMTAHAPSRVLITFQLSGD